MKRIDRLFIKAASIKPNYGDLFIIRHEDGIWKVGEEGFQTLDDAESYIDKMPGNDALIIVNDAELKAEGSALVYDENKVETGNSVRCAPNPEKSNKHGSKRGNGDKGSQYYHTWV